MLFLQKKGQEVLVKNFTKEMISLPDFSVVVGLPQSSFEIISGTENLLRISYKGKKNKIQLPYFIKKDTLFITERIDNKNQNRFFIIECKAIQTLIANKTNNIFVHNFKNRNFKIINDNSDVYLGLTKYNNKKIITVDIDSLNYKGTKSTFIVENIQIKDLNIQLNYSEMKIMSGVNVGDFTINLADSSSLIKYSSKSGNIKNTNLIADKSSYCDIVKY